MGMTKNEALSALVGGYTGDGGTDYDDNVKAAIEVLSKYLADGDGDFAAGSILPSNVSIYDVLGAFSGDGGANQDDSVKASLDLAHTDLDAILADIGDASGATLGSLLGILGDPANTITADIATVDGVVDTNQDFLDGTTAIPTAYKRESGVTQTAVTTEDLAQAAASYTLFTGTTQDVLLKSLVIRLPNVNCADDAALTSIAIHTDDVTNSTIISAASGAVANLTAEAQIGYTGAVLIKAGTIIQLTIAGGAADAATVCDVIAEYVALTSGGYLA